MLTTPPCSTTVADKPAAAVGPPSQQQQGLSSARERRRRTRQHDSPSIGARIVLRSRSNEKLPSPAAATQDKSEQKQEVISLLDSTLQLLPEHSSPPLDDTEHSSPPLDDTEHSSPPLDNTSGAADHTLRLRERNRYLRQ